MPGLPLPPGLPLEPGCPPLPGLPLDPGWPPWPPWPCCPCCPDWPDWPADARSLRLSWSWFAAAVRSRFVATLEPASVSDCASWLSADFAPAVSPWARLWAASRSDWADAPPARLAVPWSSVSSRARSRSSCSFISSSLLPRSLRSSDASCGSPSGFACWLPVALLESARLRLDSAAARCSFAGFSWDRRAASTAPSLARLVSRSLGLSRNWRARSRSSRASWVRGSSVWPPFEARSSARRSRRSAVAVASSRTARACAIAASCGFGSSIVGASAIAMTSMATAGRRDRRGRKRSAGTRRNTASASRRCRRTNRMASASSSGAGCSPWRMAISSEVGMPAAAGWLAASASAVVTRSPRRPSRSTASAVSPSDGRARTAATRRPSTPIRGSVAPIAGAASIGTSRAVSQRASSTPTTMPPAIQARRTIRRSQRRRPWPRRWARRRSSSGSSGPVIARRGSSGRCRDSGTDPTVGRPRRGSWRRGTRSRVRRLERADIRRTLPWQVDAGCPAGGGASDVLD